MTDTEDQPFRLDNQSLHSSVGSQLHTVYEPQPLEPVSEPEDITAEDFPAHNTIETPDVPV